MNSALSSSIAVAAQRIAAAEAILIGAGAGMGVDSGLPDFRGPEGFWRAYPPFQRLGLSFVKLATPYWFRHDPQLAWGFYGHRRNLYRSTQPHAGYAVLGQWLQRAPAGGFAFTSNVDGHFVKAGLDADRLVECHGSLEHLQCHRLCTTDIWPAPADPVVVDEASMRSVPPLPRCPRCGGLARPNVLMFGDDEWLPQRAEEQADRYRAWRRAIRGRRLVVIELGAGLSVPTVRHECETAGGTLVRINPRDSDAPEGAICLPLPALEALVEIDTVIRRAGVSPAHARP